MVPARVLDPGVHHGLFADTSHPVLAAATHPYGRVREHRLDLAGITDALQAEGIDTIRVAAEEFVPDHPLFREHSGPVDLPVARQISKELMLLPLYPDMERSDLDDIIAAVRKVTAAYAA